jgi:glycosyltransferase involved in cell wall biosynthesis
MNCFDTRWLGRHGIGRFTAEVRARIHDFHDLPSRGSPAGPLDPWRLRACLRALHADFFFSPGFNAPAQPSCAFAFCLHDLNHLCATGRPNLLRRAYYEQVIRPAVRRASVVLTVSEFSRAAICEWSQVSPDRIVNVGNGVSASFTASGARACLGKPYFIYVGNHKPHKNLTKLLRAFARSGLKQDYLLVLTGSPSRAMRGTVVSLGLDRAVRFLGSVPDGRLAELYRGGTALVLTSTYEGFGLPIVEAMSCGTPVLTSAAAALPETAGDAAVLVDPQSETGISAALQRLATDTALTRVLRENGLRRACNFSWAAVADRVERALNGGIRFSETPACASH